jgi:ACS family glucarate transporter-like MFS transporter
VETSAAAAATSPNNENKNVASLWRSKRFYIILLLWLAVCINYIDRINLSVAAPSISKEFGWDPGTMGLLFSSFFWTYVIFMVPTGWLIDRWGSRKVYALTISVWSAAAMLTGAAIGFASLLTARLALGAGEAGTYPAGGKAIRQWFPAKERGFVTAFFNSGASAGPAMASPVIAWLVVAAGWRASFFITGAIGFVWLFFWLRYYNHPRECGWLPPAEREYLLANTDTRPVAAPAAAGRKGTILRLFLKRTTWGLLATQGSGTYGTYLFLTWLPSYLVQAKGFALMKAGIFSSVPFLVAFVVVLFVGRMSDWLLAPDDVAKGRRRNIVIAVTLLSAVVFFTTLIDNEYLILALITVSVTALSCSTGLNLALANDLIGDPAITGSVFSIVVLGSNIIAQLAPLVTGYIVKATGSFESAFFLAGAVLAFGSLMCFTCSRKRIYLD